MATYKKHGELLEFSLIVKFETPAAFLLSDGTDENWFPKSQIDWEETAEVGGTFTFYIPEWLAEEKGLI